MMFPIRVLELLFICSKIKSIIRSIQRIFTHRTTLFTGKVFT